MTRLAIISDIHGNLPALEATLADIASQNIKTILCLGDVATFGPQPRDTMLKLQALNCPVIMGNGDMDISNPAPLARLTGKLTGAKLNTRIKTGLMLAALVPGLHSIWRT
jgi:predicted phosphodiesterase